MALNDSWYLYPLAIDTAFQSLPETLFASPEDYQGKGIALSITEDGAPLDTSGCTVLLAWHNLNSGKSNSRSFSAVNAAQGRWKCTYPTDMLTSGLVRARIVIKAASGNPVTSSREFTVRVEHNITNELRGQAKDDLSAFQEGVIALNKTNKEVQDAEAKRVDAEKARVDAESVRAIGESGRVEAEEGRASAETARETAETKRVDAEKNRASTEEERGRVEAERVEAESARSTAEAARARQHEEAMTQAAAATKRAEGSATQAQGAAQNATAAGNQALAIANSIAAGSAGDSDIAAMKAQIDALGSQLAEATGNFMLVGTTIYAPSSKASITGGTITLPTSSISGTTITLE